MNAMFPLIWFCTFLLSLSFWGLGAWLLNISHAPVRLAVGWALFLGLCSLGWFCGITGQGMRPLLLGLYGLGLYGLWKQGSRTVWLSAFLCSGVATLVYVFPYVINPKLLAYGSFGTDMWGYVSTSEWLRTHVTSELPLTGHPMRYNWIWHVLKIQERPLTYVSLSDLGASLFLSPVQGYMVYPTLLMSTLAMALVLSPGVFGLRSLWLLCPVALMTVLHPLPYLHFAAQYFSGVLVGGIVCLCFLVLASPHQEEERIEVFSLVLFLGLLCGPLYVRPFFVVASVLGGVPLVWALLRQGWGKGWNTLGAAVFRWPVFMFWMLSCLLVWGTHLLTMADDSDVAGAEKVGHMWGQVLTLFGGVSPYPFYGFADVERWLFDPGLNLLGWILAGGLLVLLVYVSLLRWKDSKDISMPVLSLVAFLAIFRVFNNHEMMTRVLPIFGPALLAALAMASQGIQRRLALGLCVAVCCLPVLRSSPELSGVLRSPMMEWNEDSGDPDDGGDWMLLAYLHFNEDSKGCNWTKYPVEYFDITHFLPMTERIRIARELHQPPPKPD